MMRPVMFLAFGFLTGVLAAQSPGTVLFQSDFEKDDIGKPPAGWGIYADAGNSALVVVGPEGARCVKLTDTGGTVWKPMITGNAKCDTNVCVQLDFDWYVVGSVDVHEKALTACIRMEGNASAAYVAIGGPRGIAVANKFRWWTDLNVPVRELSWNHMTIRTGPMGAGRNGWYDVVIVQGGETNVFENITFNTKWDGSFVEKPMWMSPMFQLGGTKVAGAGTVVYIDNVKLVVVPDAKK